MEYNKNDSLFTYIDSLDTQDFYSNHRNKKIPKLNKYAKSYLLQLEKENSNKEINSNNSSKNNNNISNENENMNDKISSIKDFSNDLTNNDSIIKNFQNKNASNESNQLKTIDYLAIEKLKKNIENKSRKENVISKVYNFTISHDNVKDSNNKVKKNVKINKYFGSIIPSDKIKLKSHLFFNFNLINSTKLQGKIKSLNNIKTQCNLFFNKTKKIFPEENSQKKFNFSKINIVNNFNKNKNNKKLKASPLVNNICFNYIKRHNNKIKKKKLISNPLTKNSCCISMISKNDNKNKARTITLNDYWIEKEIKKKFKIMKLIKEKNQKETEQLREKPKISRDSRIIAERLYSNNSSVFERLSGSTNKILFNGRKSNLLTKSINKNKNNKTSRVENVYVKEENFITFKQLEKEREMKKNKKNILVKKTTTRNNDYLNKSETHRINNKYS